MNNLRDTIYYFLQDKKNIFFLILGFILVYIVSFAVRDFSSSLFVQHRDRVNLVMYGQQTIVYSFGTSDVGEYAVLFYPDLRVRVPGGYGDYRVGALGKLIHLENDPDLLIKSFSADLSTFIDFYFYEGGVKDRVYYGDNYEESTISKPSVLDIFSKRSNAGFFDKIYLATLITNKNTKDLQIISYLRYTEENGDKILSYKDFLRQFQGVFYQSTYRKENKNVQILFEGRYKNANVVSSILDGVGIRTSDISYREGEDDEESEKKQCVVIEQEGEGSVSARRIASFFDCRMKKGDTDIYDILVEMGSLEDEWEVE